MKKSALCTMFLIGFAAACVSQTVTLRYSHPNAPGSIAGMQAEFFASKVKEYSKGSVIVEIYPSSQLGSLQEQAEQVSVGVVALHHTTAAALGSLFDDFAVLDTPYLYKNVDQLLKVTDPDSPVMRKLNEGLLNKAKVRVLYTFYFGTRVLTADRPILKPTDLAGKKIRSVPFPMYLAAVEGMGATPVPLDWSETPAALKTKIVSGQENPVNTILASKLYEVQSYLMLTNHIIAASIVVINESAYRKLGKDQQAALLRAAKEASAYGTRLTLDQEAFDLQALRDKGMKVIGEAEGLDMAAMMTATKKLIAARFGSKYAEYYKLINEIK